jgi:uncharacterized membrane protein YuzA (DUF378 family)
MIEFFFLLVIGGLNWLLYGLLSTDVGSWLGGMDTPLARIIYILVGLAAIYELVSHKRCCKMCDKGMSPNGGMK